MLSDSNGFFGLKTAKSRSLSRIFAVQGVAIYENGEQGGVNFRVVGDFTYLFIGKIRDFCLLVSGHNRNRPAQLLQLLRCGACQHTKFAYFNVIFELLAHNSTVFIAGELCKFIEVLVN